MEHIAEALIELLEAIKGRHEMDSNRTEPPSEHQRKIQQGIIELYELKEEGENLVFTFEFKARKTIKKSEYFSNRIASSAREITKVLIDIGDDFNEQVGQLALKGLKLCQKLSVEEDPRTT